MVRIVVKKQNTVQEQDSPPAAHTAPAANAFRPMREISPKALLGRPKGRVRDMSIDQVFASLTPKQKGFVTALVKSGMTKSAAYRQAYDTEANPLCVAGMAQRVAKKPHIKRILDESYQREWTGAITDADDIRRTVLRTLRDVALNGDRDNNRVAAAVALGKVSTVALFSERREVIHRNEGALDVQLELAARLQAMLGPAQVVDTVAVSDQSQMPQQGTIDAEAPATLPESPEPDPQV